MVNDEAEGEADHRGPEDTGQDEGNSVVRHGESHDSSYAHRRCQVLEDHHDSQRKRRDNLERSDEHGQDRDSADSPRDPQGTRASQLSEVNEGRRYVRECGTRDHGRCNESVE